MGLELTPLCSVVVSRRCSAPNPAQVGFSQSGHCSGLEEEMEISYQIRVMFCLCFA